MDCMSPRHPKLDPSVTHDHRRQWRDCTFVYPVISRRAKGLSIGVNLNIDKRCNFGCVYCQINRRIARRPQPIDLVQLGRELDQALQAAKDGSLWDEERFSETPEAMRRINDIAFSGDGEPTCLPNFDLTVQAAADALGRHEMPTPVKIVVITNATNLRSEQVRRALPILDRTNGELWAKLDAGTEERFKQVNRPAAGVGLQDILDNILAVAVARPVVVQTLWFRENDLPPAPREIESYCDRLRWLVGNGGQVKLVQLHTIARPPAEANVAALPDAALDAVAETVRTHLSGIPGHQTDAIPVEVYYGRDVTPQEQR